MYRLKIKNKDVYNKSLCSVGLFAHAKRNMKQYSKLLIRYFTCAGLRSVHRNHRSFIM